MGWALRLAGAGILLGAWIAWFVGARVGLYEVSDAALETGGFVHASTAGRRRVAPAPSPGDTVAAGDVLFEIDPSSSATSSPRARRG